MSDDDIPDFPPKRSAFMSVVGRDFDSAKPETWPDVVVRYLELHAYKREWLKPLSVQQDGIVCIDAANSHKYGIMTYEKDQWMLLTEHGDIKGNPTGYFTGIGFGTYGTRKVAPEASVARSRPGFPLGFKVTKRTHRNESAVKALALRRHSGYDPGKVNPWWTNGATAVTDSKHRAGFLHQEIEELLLAVPDPEIVDLPDSDYGEGLLHNGNSDVTGSTRKLMRLASQVAPTFRGYVAHLRPLINKDTGKLDKADVNDYLFRFGFDYFYEAFVVPASPWRPKRSGPTALVEFKTANEIMSEPDAVYTVAGLIPKGSVAALFALYSSGKTFDAQHLCICICRGVPWHGKETKQGAAFYFLLEGGMKKRLQAYELEYDLKIADLPFHIHNKRIDLLDEDFVQSVIDKINTVENPGIAVIDTVARATPGADENSAKDMGQLIAAVDRIRLETSCAVLLIAHPGKDPSKGLRGSSAIPGAIDVELTMWRSNSDLAVPLHGQSIGISTVKPPRDDEPWQHAFQFKQVNLGDGQSSLVVQEVCGLPVPPRPSPQRGSGKDKPATLGDELMDALRTKVECTEDELLETAMRPWLKLRGEPNGNRKYRDKKKSYKRALDKLVADNVVLRGDGDETLSIG